MQTDITHLKEDVTSLKQESSKMESSLEEINHTQNGFEAKLEDVNVKVRNLQGLSENYTLDIEHMNTKKIQSKWKP